MVEPCSGVYLVVLEDRLMAEVVLSIGHLEIMSEMSLSHCEMGWKNLFGRV
jgi:hypothetical protein